MGIPLERVRKLAKLTAGYQRYRPFDVGSFATREEAMRHLHQITNIMLNKARAEAEDNSDV